MIECVPNVSEGTRRSTIEALARAVVASGCRLLDLHSDPDHDRSVLTFVGDEASLFDGIVSMTREAAERIDLRVQRGVHPRMGAVDVIPFVPLSGASMADCVRLAGHVGRAIGETLGIPVLLYAAAASSAARRDLASVRRGQFEGLAEKLAQAEWAPDFGPPAPHPTAGAVAIGARDLLVAYNVVLGTDDLSIARRIAGRIREANGGLDGVKALGLRLARRGLVQVSMNLTAIERTDIPEAYRRVAAEAETAGVSVVDSEIVGLAPRAAFGTATAAGLRLDRDLEAAVLENRLAAT